MENKLVFGTSGIRLIMGAGADKLNLGTVGIISLGLANYLKNKGGGSKKKPPSVCICYDTRHNSKEFAIKAGTVFKSEGIKVFLHDGAAPTPYLSYLVGALKCDAGVMITASHNPKEWNGYKVYNSRGYQLTDDESGELAKYIDSVGKVRDFKDVAIGSSEIVDAEEGYLRAVKSSVDRFFDGKSLSDLKILFSPLFGAGGKFIKKAFEYYGVKLDIVHEQFEPNGDFPNLLYPNPGDEKAFELAKEYALKNGSDLIVASDPDADRMGVCVRVEAGEYVHLSGNEVGVLIADYLLRCGDNKDKVVVRSLVSTNLVDKIAAKHGADVLKVPTGFKYIGERMIELGDRFLFGFEESCGYLSGDYTKDKDAVEASLLIAFIASEYKKGGKTLVCRLNEIYDEYGYHLHETVSLKLGEGASTKEFMDGYRNDGKNKIDYLAGGEGFFGMDMLEYDEWNKRIIIRPSGTEPLVRFYFSAIGDREWAAAAFKEFKKGLGV